MARPPTPINEDQVRHLARRGWNYEEIGVHFGVSGETIRVRFSELIKEGRLGGNAAIKDMIWDRASAGDVRMIERLDDRRNGPIPKKFEITKEMAIEVLENELKREGVSASTPSEGTGCTTSAQSKEPLF